MDFIKRVFGYMKAHASTFILFALAIIALVAAIALPGITSNIAPSDKIKGWAEINLINLVIGNSNIVYRLDENVTLVASTGGISYFAIATFALFFIGIALLILDLVKPGKNFKFFGLMALILSCITVFLVPLMGTPISILPTDPALIEAAGEDVGSWAFRDFVLVRKYKVGIAAYFYCISLVLFGLSQFFKELGRIRKEKGKGQKKY